MTGKKQNNMDDLNGQSLDIIQALKEQLYPLMPEVFTEGMNGKMETKLLMHICPIFNSFNRTTCHPFRVVLI